MTIFHEICLFSFFFSGFNYNGTKLGDFTRNFNGMFRTCGRMFGQKYKAIVFHKVCPSFSFSFSFIRNFWVFFQYSFIVFYNTIIYLYTFHSKRFVNKNFFLSFFSSQIIAHIDINTFKGFIKWIEINRKVGIKKCRSRLVYQVIKNLNFR